jgi:hypothetical protein
MALDATPVPAAARLEAAKAALGAAKKQIPALEDRRRAALLGDDDTAAAAIDIELENTRRLIQRLADKIVLLPSVVVGEEMERRFPNDAGAAQARLAALQKEASALAAKQGRPHEPTSADADFHLLKVRKDIQLLEEHIQTRTLFQWKDTQS